MEASSAFLLVHLGQREVAGEQPASLLESLQVPSADPEETSLAQCGVLPLADLPGP